MAKKVLSLLLALVCILSLLAGCNGGGKDSSETPSKTPSEPAHQHEWREANYQEPKTCTECDETEGEPIPPKFSSLGFELKEIGVTYTYKSCYEDKSDATAKATVKDVRIIFSDDYYEQKEGCEWIIATCVVEVVENPKVFQIAIERTDFYCYDLNTKFPTNVVNYYGADREIEIKTKMIKSTSTIMEFEAGYLVPVGYDGVIFAFFNDYNNMIIDYSNPDTVAIFGDILDGDTLFFRLKK
ncbi:MAG: hypothetical protein FWG21_05870 [Oscillospiraceae bacterium]|nr:hypothetical protein [Oscillospiraceae bacterium]